MLSMPGGIALASFQFGIERMIRAQHGLLEKWSLEEKSLVAEGEDHSIVPAPPAQELTRALFQLLVVHPFLEVLSATSPWSLLVGHVLTTQPNNGAANATPFTISTSSYINGNNYPSYIRGVFVNCCHRVNVLTIMRNSCVAIVGTAHSFSAHAGNQLSITVDELALNLSSLAAASTPASVITTGNAAPARRRFNPFILTPPSAPLATSVATPANTSAMASDTTVPPTSEMQMAIPSNSATFEASPAHPARACKPTAKASPSKRHKTAAAPPADAPMPIVASPTASSTLNLQAAGPTGPQCILGCLLSSSLTFWEAEVV
ncbi:hypothetical protein CPB84DRAFT_1845537 [Gymnopilus junonius]|uniref:Uncharacterized protein n=1 Tax=Gymnopilus junonius TaxID=109634 RepID=A0A9P5TP09_GYMJU|nr:hypothetical protein CPB84DRAFT_1845537 [Gymnopilus junonius]